MNLLGSDDLSKGEIQEVFGIADRLAEGKEQLALGNKSTVALYFTEPSTRTRVSFQAAAAQLGGTAIYIDSHTSQASRGEALSDTARMLSMYCDFIAVRTVNHSDLLEMAGSSSVPVINALTKLEHPTQALADVYTIIGAKGRIAGLKIAFIGDISQNTCNSLMITAAKLGASVSLVGPRSWKPDKASYGKALKYDSKIKVYESFEEGLEGADIVYTDTFVSMGEDAQRAVRLRSLAGYQLNANALAFASPSARVMHPLPAHRGEEITGDVIDGMQSIVWEQARNKLLIEKAILLFLSGSE